MKERPILFSAPMVRAILEGRKTQTRRIPSEAAAIRELLRGTPLGDIVGLSRYRVGDRLWVRETWARASGPHWADLPHTKCPDDPHGWETVYYRASYDRATELRWRPSIFMPRWASRITLEVTEVRVQRLHEIGEEDARSEGVDPAGCDHAPFANPCPPLAYRPAFERLWDSINGKREGASWAANPWVWAITFKRSAA